MTEIFLYLLVVYASVTTVCAVPRVTIDPSIVVNGDLVKITCADTENFGALNLKRVNSDRDSPVLATLTGGEFTVSDTDVANRVPESGRSKTSNQFSLDYQQTKCDIDARSYFCASQVFGKSDRESLREELTVIDIPKASPTISTDPDCPDGMNQNQCDQCTTSNENSLHTAFVGKKGKEIVFSCRAALVFPSTSNITPPNKFRWYIKNGKSGDWLEARTDDISDNNPRRKTLTPTTKSPNTAQSYCVKNSETRTSKLTYTPDEDALSSVSVKCEVVFTLKGKEVNKREAVVNGCISGGKEDTTTPPPPGTEPTPGTGEVVASDAGMIAGIVIAVIAALILVGVLVYFLWYRKRETGANKYSAKDAELKQGGGDYKPESDTYDNDPNLYDRADAQPYTNPNPLYDHADMDDQPMNPKPKPSTRSSNGSKNDQLQYATLEKTRQPSMDDEVEYSQPMKKREPTHYASVQAPVY